MQLFILEMMLNNVIPQKQKYLINKIANNDNQQNKSKGSKK